MIPGILQDPYFIFGFIFILAHFTGYYLLLEKISNKIKQKRDDALKNFERKITKKIKLSLIVSLHKEIHKIQDDFEVLEGKVSSVFWAGIIIFISSLFGWGRNIFPSLQMINSLVNLFIGISLIVLFINLISLLNWNLKNK